MNRILQIIVIAAALVVASSPVALSEAQPHLTLDFVIIADQPFNPPGSVVGTLSIKNTGNEPLTVEHPDNRLAIAFIVINSLGNVVSPEGIAKVDPRFQQITIQPHSEFNHPFYRLEFLTGSGLFGYTLKSNETYHLIAVYRPGGQKGTGITSPERTFSAK